VYLAALVTNLVFSYAEGQKHVKSLGNLMIMKTLSSKDLLFFLGADLFTSFWSSIGSSIQYLRLRLFFFWFFFSFSFSFGNLNYWIRWKFLAGALFLLVGCLY
jgi:hypothetical protein